MTRYMSSSVERFQNLEIDATTFGHREHIEIAFEMLDAYDFIEALSRYASTIKALTEKHGVPEKYNATITFAFMSLIAERRLHCDAKLFDDFLSTNDDLLEGNILSNWYSRSRLASAEAKQLFLLPDISH